MKSISAIAAFAACASFCVLSGCASGQRAEGEYEENPVFHQSSAADADALKSAAPLTSERALLYVNGMGCPLCATNVDVQLKRIRGVEDATIDLGAGTVAISMPGQTRPSPKRLADAVADAGFTLVRIENN